MGGEQDQIWTTTPAYSLNGWCLSIIFVIYFQSNGIVSFTMFFFHLDWTITMTYCLHACRILEHGTKKLTSITNTNPQHNDWCWEQMWLLIYILRNFILTLLLYLWIKMYYVILIGKCTWCYGAICVKYLYFVENMNEVSRSFT